MVQNIISALIIICDLKVIAKKQKLDYREITRYMVCCSAHCSISTTTGL